VNPGHSGQSCRTSVQMPKVEFFGMEWLDQASLFH
jgi:hypothetical protein